MTRYYPAPPLSLPGLLPLSLLLVLLLAGRSVAAVPPSSAAPPSSDRAAAPTTATLVAILEAERAEAGLPALAGAVIVGGRTVAVAAVGVRRAGHLTPVTVDDQFHLGSCTKAMTAALIAQAVEQGALRWDATLGEVFPELADAMAPPYRRATIEHLLTHRAGLAPAGRSWPEGMSFQDVHRLPGSPRRQRYEYLQKMLAQSPECDPGEAFHYSNAGYTALGVALEQALDQSWEGLMAERLFGPLGMASAGFGAMGDVDRMDQPWQHRSGRRPGTFVPVPPGPMADNPDAIGPGGKVHASMADWARFIAAMLAGAQGRPGLMAPETCERLLTPPPGGDYAGGWHVARRDWGGGRVYSHTGSNNMNFAVVWMAPQINGAVMVATNAAGDGVDAACDRAIWKTIQAFLLAGEGGE